MDIKVKEYILGAIKTAVDQWLKKENLILENPLELLLELPKVEAHGDLSTNIAFQLASIYGKKPRDIAGEIVKFIQIPSDICEKIEPAGAGFINFYLALPAVYNLLQDILIDQRAYGRAFFGKGKSILLEFVSANPTGPLTIAHARQAAVGDVLADILSTVGYKVEREYYLNDRGRQMNILAMSTRARYMELLDKKVDFPEDGYQGEYIRDIARKILKESGDKYLAVSEKASLDFFMEYSKTEILNMIKKDLKSFGVEFNNWVSEKELVSLDNVENVLKKLEEKGHLYIHEGAKWFRTTKFNDDKDRVLVKSSGEMTYLAPDIAYHYDKYRRDFDILINIWGPDHHGYVPRLSAAVSALGYSRNTLKVLLVQLTTLYRDGEPVSMSTRAGEFVSLRELVSEVGKDAARYYLVMRRPEAHLDFDLEVAKRETPDNPVYYIQYAHARISSIFKKYEEVTGTPIKDINWDSLEVSFLKEPEEINIIKYLSQYPIILQDCSRILSPHLLTDYLEGLVSKFHNYYEKHRIISSNKELTFARIAVIYGIKIVLQNALRVLGVSVPERM